MESFNNLSRSIKGRVALITGAASGMGKATAQVFAAEGARVIVTDVNEGEAKNVSEQIESDGGEALAMTLDITDEEQIKELETNLNIIVKEVDRVLSKFNC